MDPPYFKDLYLKFKVGLLTPIVSECKDSQSPTFNFPNGLLTTINTIFVAKFRGTFLDANFGLDFFNSEIKIVVKQKVKNLVLAVVSSKK